MPRPIMLPALLCLVAGLVAGCAREGPAYGPEPTDVAAVVTMTNGFSFSPATVRLPVGGTIEWRNTSIATHTVTDDPARVGDEASLPAGVEPFSSGSIPPGQVWRHTFAVPGRYDYVCLPHHDLFGMRGTVEVQP